ncbi:MAG: DUF4082 domain-containing protein [bacterium]|nr:DUF4082 domain-containing protein [bacterium]
MKKLQLTVIALLIAGLPLAAAADTIAFAPTVGGLIESNTMTFGFEFEPTEDIAVTALGHYDHADDGLVAAHQVGIFNLDGSIVAQTTIPAGTAGQLQDGYRFIALDPAVTLTAGQRYRIGIETERDEHYPWQMPYNFAPQVIKRGNVLQGQGNGLVFPDTNAGSHSRAPVNFLFSGGGGGAVGCTEGWQTVFKHNLAGGFFANKTEAEYYNAHEDPANVDRFSRLRDLESLRGADGNFHFKIVYPALGSDVNEWKQSSNPFNDPVAGYQPIDITWTTQHWGGLEKSTDGRTLIDGSVNHPYWFYSIGSNAGWSGGIPGPNSPVQHVELQACGNPLPVVDPPAAVECNEGWQLVFKHDSTGGWFAGDAEAQNANAWDESATKFSRLNELENLRGGDGKFHFKLAYPESGAQVNEWKQSSNPVTTQESVQGYEAVDINWTGQYWGGLAKSSAGQTFIDGSVGHGNWFYSIGSNTPHQGKIPGPDTTTVTKVELYACGNPLPAAEAPVAVECNEGWQMVFRHDSTGGFFTGNEAESINAGEDPANVAKFSRLSELESLRGADGKFHFKLAYPEVGTQVNEWKQSSDPVTTQESVQGYEAVDISWTGQYWGGLAKSSNPSTFIDGSVGHGHWWYSIGSVTPFGGKVPGPADITVTKIELYACGNPLPAAEAPGGGAPGPVASFADGTVITLRADSGKYLGRCNNCQNAAYPDTAAVHVDNPDEPWAKFVVENLGEGKIALKADSGKYLTRCNNCVSGGAYPDFLTVHVDNPSGRYAQFHPYELPNGKIAFQVDDSQKYFGRCNNCSPGAAYPDTVAVHVDDPTSEPWAQWEVSEATAAAGSESFAWNGTTCGGPSQVGANGSATITKTHNGSNYDVLLEGTLSISSATYGYVRHAMPAGFLPISSDPQAYTCEIQNHATKGDASGVGNYGGSGVHIRKDTYGGYTTTATLWFPEKFWNGQFTLKCAWQTDEATVDTCLQ